MATPDYSSMSNEQLAQMAGISLPSSGVTDLGTIGLKSEVDYSSMSNDELMKRAGITPTSPTWGQSARYIGKNLAAGVGDVLGMGLDALPVQRSPFPQMQPSNVLKNLISGVAGRPEDEGIVGAPAEIAGAVARGSVFPEGQIASAISSGSSKLGQILYPESKVAPVLFGVGGGALTSAASGASRAVSNNLKGKSGEMLEKALGIQYGDRVKGLNRAPVYIDDAGDVLPFDQMDDAASIQAPIQAQVERLKNKGFLDGVKNGADDLKIHITNKSQDVGKQIGSLTTEADNALQGLQLPVQFEKAQAYVNRFRDTPKERLQKQLDSIINDYQKEQGSGFKKLTNYTDKIQLETPFDSATPKEITQLKRLAAFDLRKSSEDYFDLALPNKAGQFGEANKDFAALASVGKTVNKRAAKQEPGYLDYLTGGSKPVGIAAGLATAATGGGLGLGLTIGGGIVGLSGLAKGAAAKSPVTASRIYDALSKGAKLAPSLNSNLVGGAAGVSGDLESLAEVPGLSPNVSPTSLRESQFPIGAKESQTKANALSLSSLANPSPNTTTTGENVNRKEFEAAVKPSEMPEPKLTPIPSQLNSLSKKARIEKTADFVKAQPPLIQAIIAGESSGDPFALSPTGPRGLMGLAKIIRDAYGGKDGWDPRQNVKAGTAFLQHLAEKYQDPKIVLASFNQGETVINNAIKKAGLTKKTADWESIKEFLPTKEGKNYPDYIIDHYNKITRA